MKVYLQKTRSIIRKSVPKEIPPLLTPEQVEKLKAASGVALVLVGVAGAILLSAVAPNAFVAINKLFLKKSRYRKLSHGEKEQKVIRSFYYLKKHGYIRMKPTREDVKIFLTKLGRRKLQKMNLENLTVTRPGKWDNKWWVIAADIPTKKYKWAADLFRQKLKDMKFYHLQRTLWLYPYDPRKEISFLGRYYRIGRFMTLMEINRLDRDDEASLQKFFRKEKII